MVLCLVQIKFSWVKRKKTVFGVLAHINLFVTSGETLEFMELSRSQYPKDCLNQGGR